MEKNQELIKSYVEGQLSEIDRLAFDNIIAIDPEIAAEVQLFRDLKTVTQNKELFDLKQKLRETMATTAIEPDFSNTFDADFAEKGKNTEGAFFSKISRWTWFIVTILVALAALFWAKNKETQRIQGIVQTIDFQPFENTIQFDSTDTRPLARALTAYNQKAYTEAESLFAQHLKSNPTDNAAVFYLGMCQALTGRFDRAAQAFELSLKASNNPLTTPTQWYLSLCYLHSGQTDKALLLLNNLKTDTFFGDKAHQLLGKLGQ